MRSHVTCTYYVHMAHVLSNKPVILNREVILAPRGPLAMSGNILFVTTWGVPPVPNGSGQGCC